MKNPDLLIFLLGVCVGMTVLTLLDIIAPIVLSALRSRKDGES